MPLYVFSGRQARGNDEPSLTCRYFVVDLKASASPEPITTRERWAWVTVVIVEAPGARVWQWIDYTELANNV